MHIDEAKKIVKDFLGLCGLGLFQFNLIEKLPDLSNDKRVVIALDYTIERPRRMKELVSELMFIKETILQSQIVTQETSPLKAEIEVLKKRIDQMKDEIADLKRYEAHFQLEMNMRHNSGIFGKRNGDL